jgi:hypothetical protein
MKVKLEKEENSSRGKKTVLGVFFLKFIDLLVDLSLKTQASVGRLRPALGKLRHLTQVFRLRCKIKTIYSKQLLNLATIGSLPF